MLRQQVQEQILDALEKIGIKPSLEELNKLKIDYPEPQFGDYSSNAALILAKEAKIFPKELAEKIIAAIDKTAFEKVEVAGPGFVNFWVKREVLLESLNPSPGASRHPLPVGEGKFRSSLLPKGEGARRADEGKILLEYFQPNIAKPLHVGHMRTAIIGDAIKRMLKYAGYNVESDTHMGDWGTQFGFLILGVKKMPDLEVDEAYVKLNEQAETDPSIREAAKQEFVKLEQGDRENRKIWQQLVEESVRKFLDFATAFDLLPFEHHWPESFYEDKMPKVVAELKNRNLLKRSEGAWIVDLEQQALGVAIILKSDGGTTYLLRDLATFIFGKQQGFTKHLYVVDNRQSLHYKQLFAILTLMGELPPLHPPLSGGEIRGVHIDYGFISFKGEALSTRKGNIVTPEEVLEEAEEKVAKLIAEKNPDLRNKDEVVKYVAIAALKFFDLSHNRHSDIEFDWKQVLDFEGKSGPYLQYTHARLASILRNVIASAAKQSQKEIAASSTTEVGTPRNDISATERRILFLLSIFNEKVSDALQDYLPNIFADYLYDLTNHLNRFYHESPVLQEKDETKKAFRLGLVAKAKEVLGKGLDLLGIRALDEM